MSAGEYEKGALKANANSFFFQGNKNMTKRVSFRKGRRIYKKKKADLCSQYKSKHIRINTKMCSYFLSCSLDADSHTKTITRPCLMVLSSVESPNFVVSFYNPEWIVGTFTQTTKCFHALLFIFLVHSTVWARQLQPRSQYWWDDCRKLLCMIYLQKLVHDSLGWMWDVWFPTAECFCLGEISLDNQASTMCLKWSQWHRTDV